MKISRLVAALARPGSIAYRSRIAVNTPVYVAGFEAAFADRRLIGQCFIDMFGAGDRLVLAHLYAIDKAAAPATCTKCRSPASVCRSRRSGHHRHDPRGSDIKILEIVSLGAQDRKRRSVPCRRSGRMIGFAGDVGAGQRVGLAHDFGWRSVRYQRAAVAARARTRSTT